MPRRRSGERVLGPYAPSGRRKTWRVRHIHSTGESVDFEFTTESAAQKAKAELEAAIEHQQPLVAETVGQAIDAYLASPDITGNRDSSQEHTKYAMKAFFDRETALFALTPARGAKLYKRLVDKGAAVDTHRGYLAAAKKFCDWCVKHSLLPRNPLADVKGVGKRKKGKPQLRYRDARAWYRKAMELAHQGDEGAIAALVSLVMAMRSSEITHLRVDDVDEVYAPGDTLWLDKSKTSRSERVLDVAEELQPLLLMLCEGKRPDDLLFPARDKRGRVLPRKPHWRDWVADQVRRICREAGIKEVCAHSMRGMHSTMAIDRGMSARMVADTLGHEDERTTLEAYAEKRAQRASRQRRVLKVLRGGDESTAERAGEAAQNAAVGEGGPVADS